MDTGHSVASIRRVQKSVGSIALVLAAALSQTALFLPFAMQSGREVARFLDALSFDDTWQSFSGLRGDSAYHDLGVAMTRVLERAASQPDTT
jgi:hypothetical protein